MDIDKIKRALDKIDELIDAHNDKISTLTEMIKGAKQQQLKSLDEIKDLKRKKKILQTKLGD